MADSIQITKGSEADRTGQEDKTTLHREATSVRTPGDRISTEKPGGQRTEVSELGVIDFAFEIIVTMQTPCKRLDYA